MEQTSSGKSWDILCRLFAQVIRSAKGLCQVSEGVWAVAIASAVFALYVVTLAPTVIWGDDATFQLAAVRGDLHASAGSHPAWVALAHLFTKLPIGELAYRVNLAAAFSAALAIGFLFVLLRSLRISYFASIVGSLSLAISHTFWAHAVRPETYALTIATLGLLVWAGLQWYQRGQGRDLVLVGIAWGLALTTHVFVLLYVPAFIWLFLTQPRRLTRRNLVILGGTMLLALTPLGWLLWRDSQAQNMNIGETLQWALFTFDGYDFAGQMFHRAGSNLVTDAWQWAVFLGYQFVGPALILGVLGFWRSWRSLPRNLSVFIVLLYLVPAAFAFSYQVGDRYVFFLPSYLVFAIWIALGADQMIVQLRQGKITHKAYAMLQVGLLISILVIPTLTYRLTPAAMAHFGLSFRESRYVPGPNSRYFILWPPKNGYYDARDFAEAALSNAPANALLLADPALATPMVYLQQVEGFRPDVTVRFCCWDIDQALAEGAERPLALADVTPTIYPVHRLQLDYQLTLAGPIYVLSPK